MRLDIHVHIHPDRATAAVLDAINHKVGHIMTKLSELESKLSQVNEQLGKIGNETGTLVQQVADLREQLENQDLPEGAEAALAALEATAKRVDDMVPDPVEPPSDGGSGT